MQTLLLQQTLTNPNSPHPLRLVNGQPSDFHLVNTNIAMVQGVYLCGQAKGVACFAISLQFDCVAVVHASLALYGEAPFTPRD